MLGMSVCECLSDPFVPAVPFGFVRRLVFVVAGLDPVSYISQVLPIGRCITCIGR